MKKCDKRNSHISRKLQMIYISSNNSRHPVAKTYTSLQYTCRHFTSSQVHPTSPNCISLHFTTLSCGLATFKFPTASFHPTALHFTHCTFRRFSPHFYSFHYTPFIIAFLTLSLKIFGLQGKAPKASAGSWF